jgi:AcrR family transcriptional regulator
MRSESDRNPSKTEKAGTYLHSCKEFTSKRPRISGGSPDLTEKRILAAAERVFSRDGFQGATTHEIAQQAGVNEVTIFRHFHTREDLLGATLEHGCAEFDAMIESEEIRKGELAEGLERYVREMYCAVKQHEAIVHAFIGEARLPW